MADMATVWQSILSFFSRTKRQIDSNLAGTDKKKKSLNLFWSKSEDAGQDNYLENVFKLITQN